MPTSRDASRGARRSGRVAEKHAGDVAAADESFDALPVAVLVLDRSGVVTRANAASSKVLGVAAVGKELFGDVLPRDAFAKVADRVAAGEPVDEEVEVPDVRNPRAWHVRTRPQGDGKVASTTVVLDDVSAKRQVERTREESQSFLLHDLKSPLWAVLINLPLVVDALPPGDAKDAAVDSLVEAERLRRMLNNLQDIHRSESGVLSVNRAPADIVKIARDAVDSARRAAEMSGIEIEQDGAMWAVVNVDETLVRRLVDNLVGNALRFARSTVRVVVEEGPPPVIRVSDDGPGIPAEQREKVFERFARGKNPAGRGDNAGLGLTFCRWVARAHGGDVTIQQAEGGGAEFVVRLG